jgi:hypothetical protein
VRRPRPRSTRTVEPQRKEALQYGCQKTLHVNVQRSFEVGREKMLCVRVVFVVTSCCNVLNIHSECIQRKSLLRRSSDGEVWNNGRNICGKCALRCYLLYISAKYEATFLVVRNQGTDMNLPFRVKIILFLKAA